jgi:hypothetical protein
MTTLVTVGWLSMSAQTLSVEDRRLLALWAAGRAGEVLAIYEGAVPEDPRVRNSTSQARSFASGALATDEAIRRRGGEAGAAAREAPTPAAKAAAYAAQQAAAVAHMGAHALGAAGHAAKAAALGADPDSGLTVRLVALGHLATMGPEVVGALLLLPTLGEDRSGPLGPGRLATGMVGEAIRVIQAELRRQSA